MTENGPTNPTPPPASRLEELLIDQALFGLSDAELRELEALEQADHDESFELAAAELEVAMFEQESATAPSHLTEALYRSIPAPAFKAPSPAQAARVESSGLRFNAIAWVAAAAALVLAALAWLPQPAPSIQRQRTALIDSGATVTRIAWQALDDPSAASFVEGDVVWSDEKQEGYMRFVGLTPNDPSHEQYQLWIFDSTRSADHPVDGGVFDVSSSGEVIVPIDAKIRVRDAAMFAVTVEPPGGVVVSDRSRLPLLAQRPQG